MTVFPERLSQGYRSFVKGRLVRERARYASLGEKGQRPEILIVGCIDSRVSPEVIFDASPGEMLVVRNVAAIVPAFQTQRDAQHATSAAIEFAVQALHVKHVVVLGHAGCGGIAAFANHSAPLSPGDFIGRWMSQIAPVAEQLGEPDSDDHQDYLRRLEFACVAQSLENLMTFPWIRTAVEQGALALHGAFFGVATGRLLVRDPETGTFKPVAGSPRLRTRWFRR